MTSPRNAKSTGKGRVYTWPPTGEQFPSVTTIINAGVPKPALLNWAPKMAAEFVVREWKRLEPLIKSESYADRQEAIDTIKGAPWRDRDAAANKGTQVHDYAEKIALDPSYAAEVPEQLKGHVDSFIRFTKECEVDFEASEFSVYSRTHGYAGTGDFIARFGKFPDLGLILGDYKTNRSGIYGEIALQLAALRYADFIGLPDNSEEPLPAIDSCVGVWIGPDSYKVIPVQVDEYVFQYFLRAKDIQKWTDEVAQTVLDRELYVPAEASA